MIDQLETRCCAETTDLDRLLCRMSAHDSYGARETVESCFPAIEDPGDDR